MVNSLVIRRSLGFVLGLLLATASHAVVFPQFGPVTGILKGSATSPLTTAATASDIVALWANTCTSVKYLRANGDCDLVSLAASVTGTLPVANGGTNLTAAADDNLMVGNGTTWQTKALSDCDDTGGNHLNYDTSTNAFTCGTSGTVSGAALTRTDDTNVTLTLGGSPSTALVNAASLTLGWTGTLAASRGGLGMSTVTDDTVAVANGSAWQSKAIGDCDAAASALTYDTSTNAFGCNTHTIPTGANPSGTIGLTAVNGSAGTFTRSDGTAALSQAIAPTWTGEHQFSGTLTSASYTSMNGLSLSLSGGTDPALWIRRSGSASNTKNYALVATSAALTLSLYDDAGANQRDIFSAARSAGAVSSLTFGNSTNNPTFTFSGTGVVTSGGLLRGPNGSAANPTWSFSNDDDTGIWRSSSNVLDFGTAGTSRFSIAGDQWLATAAGSAASPNFSSLNDGNTGVSLPGSDVLALVTGGTNRATVGPGIQVGAPTGGDQGAGTVNATGIFINGVSVAGGTTTSSTFTATLTGGGFSGTVTCTLKYRLTGSQVSVFVDAGGSCTGTSTTTAFTWTGLPTAIRPSANATVTGLCTDNGTDVPCAATFQNSGAVTMFKDTGSAFSSSGWTGSGTKGFSTVVFIYDLRN